MTDETKTTTAIATLPSGELVTYDYGKLAGRGKENIRPDELAIPFINLLQGLSPEVQEGDAKFIKEARPGMFCNSVTGRLLDGKEGFIFLPLMRDNCYVQWKPKRGGFVARHDYESTVVKQAKLNAEDDFNLTVERVEVDEETGNRTTFQDSLDRTDYLYGLILEEIEGGFEIVSLVLLAFVKTKRKQYRRWFTSINESKKTKDAPLFANLVHVIAVSERNAENQPYFNFKLDALYGDVERSLIAPDDPMMVEAEAFLSKIEAGEAKADLAAQTGEKKTVDGAPDDEVFSE